MKKLLILGLIIMMLPIVYAIEPYFVDLETGSTLYLTEDENFELIVEASDDLEDVPEYPLSFAPGDITGNLPSFEFYSYNDTHGIINFTPEDGDVGLSSIVLNVVDESEEVGGILIHISVNNTNDPPNITWWSPETLNFDMYENNSQGFTFNYSASDPDLPHFDNLSNTYYWNGVNVSTDETWTYVTSFCEESSAEVLLLVTDMFGLTDSIEWTIENILNINRNPTFTGVIPTLTFPEDTNLTNNFSLIDTYFNDSDFGCTNRPDSPTFSVYGNSNLTVNITNGPNYNVSFYPEEHYYGAKYVNISMSDGSVTVFSNVFLVNITPVPDPPYIDLIPDQEVYAYADFVYDVNATDPEGDDFEFSDNTFLFNINANTGIINFTPVFAHGGSYAIQITATDNNSQENSTTLNLEIIENYAPRLLPIDDMVVGQDQGFTLAVNATDSDNDYINFTINDSLFTLVWNNETHANFSYFPTGNGSFPIKLWAHDEHRAYNSTTFLINVSYYNFDPTLDAISSPQIAKIDQEYYYLVNASDGNNGIETLTYSDNTTLFDINSATGVINFTPELADRDNYTVNISVCDDGAPVKCDWQTVEFEVTYNRNPILMDPGDQEAYEDVEFYLLLNSSDPDYDTLIFSDNASFFDVENSAINFTPDGATSGENYSIRINVSDGDNGSAFIEFNFEIHEFNDPPYFDPALVNVSLLYNLTEDVESLIYINVTDEEENEMDFSLEFLNGTSFFTWTILDDVAGLTLINVTPLNNQTGNYTIRFNVTDGLNNISENVSFEVLNINDAPEIINITPFGSSVSLFTEFSWFNASDYRFEYNTTGIEINETNTIIFNQTSRDIDDTNITYNWTLDDEFLSNLSYLNYTFDYDSLRESVVSFRIRDDSGAYDEFNWNLTINDLNRAPFFGIVYDEGYSNFSNGNFTNTNVSSDGIVSLLYNGTDYASNGTFISRALDLRAEARMNVSYLGISAYDPLGTIITVYTSTSPSGVNWTDWEIVSWEDMEIDSDSSRYLKYKLFMSTSNTSKTPILTQANVSYEIADIDLKNNNIYTALIDMDDFFSDLDTDDDMEFGATDSDYLDLSFDDQNNLRVTPEGSYVGKQYITFWAYDGVDNVTSNEVKFTVTSVPGTGVSSTSTSTSTRIIMQTQIQKEKETVYARFDLIAPGLTTVYRNESIEIPLSLKNMGNESLSDIYLEAMTDAEGIDFVFSDDHIVELSSKEEINVTLIASPFKALGTYEISVLAKVTDPLINDTARIMINSREKGEHNDSQLNTKIAFTQDLLGGNPICFELNELLLKAKQSISSKEYSKAEILVNKAITDCRFLVSTKNATTESPMNVKKSNSFLLYSGIFAFIFVMSFGMVLLYKKT
jgi:hypothetical protein